MAANEQIGSDSPIVTTQVSVTTTATQIAPANNGRAQIIIKSPKSATVPVFIGPAGVTITTGIALDIGDFLTIRSTGAIFGIVAATTTTVSTVEEQQ